MKEKDKKTQELEEKDLEKVNGGFIILKPDGGVDYGSVPEDQLKNNNQEK